MSPRLAECTNAKVQVAQDIAALSAMTATQTLGIRSKLRGSILLAGGAQAKNVAIFAPAGNCEFGDSNVGSGTLFCPNGKVRMKLGSTWNGAIASGKSVDLGDNVVLTHVPFLGLAF